MFFTTIELKNGCGKVFSLAYNNIKESLSRLKFSSKKAEYISVLIKLPIDN